MRREDVCDTISRSVERSMVGWSDHEMWLYVARHEIPGEKIRLLLTIIFWHVARTFVLHFRE